MKNAWLTEIVLPTDEVKAQRVLDKVMDLFVASKYTQIAIFTFETMYEGVTIEVQLPENAQTLAWNAENKTLTVTPLQTEVAESVTIKVLINEVTLTSDPVEFVSQIVAVEAAIYDFVTNFSSYGSGWSSSYTTHTVTSAELGANLPQAKVDFTRANKQSSTITTMPVVAPKASTEYVTITLEDTTKTIKSAVFELAQWNTKTFTDIHLEYYNGSSWVTCSANVTTPGKLESTELPEGVTQVRLAVQITANSNTQLGLKSITLTF